MLAREMDGDKLARVIRSVLPSGVATRDSYLSLREYLAPTI